MAEEDTTSDDVASVFKGASSGGGTAIKQSVQERRAAEAEARAARGAPEPDPAAAAEVFRPKVTETSFSSLPTKDTAGGWWGAVKEHVADLVSSVGAPHLPWEGGGKVKALETGPPIQEPHLLAGIRRGVKDVTDTVRLTSTSDEDRKAFEDEHGDSGWTTAGRVIGQTAATAPVLGPLGRGVAAGAGYIPGVTGRVAQAVTGATPAASTVGRAGQLAAKGAATGAAEAGLTSASSDTPLGEQIGLGAATGAVMGPVIGAATKAIDVARGYVPAVRRDIAELADRLRQATRTAQNPDGVVVPVSQMTTNPTLRIMGDAAKTLPGAGTDAAALARQRGVQRAIAGTMGLDADQFGTAEMRTARDQIQQGYRAALARVGPISGGAPLATDLANAATDATRFTDAATVGHVGRAIREVSDTFARGPITPQAYRSLTNSDGPLAQIEAAAPQAAQPFLARVREAVRQRMLASAPPDVAAELRQLDARYRAMHTVRPLAERSTVGDISLGGLQQQVINASRRFDGKNTGAAFTNTPLGDIADASKQFFGHVPESGTTPRSQVFSFARNPISTTLGFLPGLTAGRFGQRWINGPTFSGRVIDTSLGGPTPDVGRFVPYGLLGPINEERQQR